MGCDSSRPTTSSLPPEDGGGHETACLAWPWPQDASLRPKGCCYDGALCAGAGPSSPKAAAEPDTGDVAQPSEGSIVYKGGLLGSLKHGEGSLILPRGASYVGQFAYDKMNGNGRFHYPSGSTYEGQWVNDMQEGSGEERWADGSVFRGQFLAGEKHGQGSFRWATGCRYEGQFVRNCMSGEGEYHWADGRGYTGQWVENRLGPHGCAWWADGRIYQGQFLDGRKHGHGNLRISDGRYYDGQWWAGKQHGIGVVCNLQGQRRASRWQHGQFLEWLGEVMKDSPRASEKGGVLSPAAAAQDSSEVNLDPPGVARPAVIMDFKSIGVKAVTKAPPHLDVDGGLDVVEEEDLPEQESAVVRGPPLTAGGREPAGAGQQGAFPFPATAVL